MPLRTIESVFHTAARASVGLACGVFLLFGAQASDAAPGTVKELPLNDIQLFADVFGSIKNFYVDDVTDQKLLENAIKGMVEGLDPHSTYLDAKAFNDIEENTIGEFGGLGLEVTKDVSGVRVVSPIDDTPAARAGVLAGDLIIKIDDKATSNLSLNENVKLMRGKPKTTIVLTIARKGVTKPVVIQLERAIIKVQSVKSKLLADRLGYIRISQFQEHTTEDVVNALKKLTAQTSLRGLVLDLRNNPGGLLNAAIGVSATFLPRDSVVVSTRGRGEQESRQFKANIKDYRTTKTSRNVIASLPQSVKTLPIVVLINPASASASEIVAGALQDHKRATIMGSRSFGKGSVQTIIPLRVTADTTMGVKITTARYYTPSGRSIQAKGISPDIAVDDTPEGNLPSFNVRESELANHIEVPGAKTPSEDAGQDDSDDMIPEDRLQALRYTFGDEKDFPLQQARARLLGKKVITHADIREAKASKKASTAK